MISATLNDPRATLNDPRATLNDPRATPQRSCGSAASLRRGADALQHGR